MVWSPMWSTTRLMRNLVSEPKTRMIFSEGMTVRHQWNSQRGAKSKNGGQKDGPVTEKGTLDSGHRMT